MRVFHGDSKTPIYHVWHAMISRCRNSKHKAYYNYGGRGIKVCKEWCDYLTFREWAVNNGYDESLTLERIDTDGNYCPENCIWATMKRQQNNRRNNHLITHNGETKTITEWASALGINENTLRSRIIKCKWGIEKAFTSPLRKWT
jgi:hypothetical protein